MILFLHFLAMMAPFPSWKEGLKSIATRIRRQCYGGLSIEDMQKLRGDLFSDVQLSIVAEKLHAETFKGFKGAFRGRDVVIVGAGPSVNKFKPIPNCIYIGLNRACVLKQVAFDYLFAIDKKGIAQYYEDFGSAKCVKFVGDQGGDIDGQIPEGEIELFDGDVRRYKTDAGHVDSGQSRFATDLETQVLGNFHTVAMQAMQFALYCRPRKIYLVGMDCSPAGHFDADPNSASEKSVYPLGKKFWSQSATRDWCKLRNFVAAHYPDTTIVSVNPVGLRGLFEDMDQ